LFALLGRGLIHPDERLASFAASRSTERIGLAEVESHISHASMFLPVLDRINLTPGLLLLLLPLSRQRQSR
jgi:hypothetical protein